MKFRAESLTCEAISRRIPKANPATPADWRAGVKERDSLYRDLLEFMNRNVERLPSLAPTTDNREVFCLRF